MVQQIAKAMIKMDSKEIRRCFRVLFSCFGRPLFGAILGLAIGTLCTLSLYTTLVSVYSATELFVIYGGSLLLAGFFIGFLRRQSHVTSATLGLAFCCMATTLIGLTSNPWSFIGVTVNGCVGLLGSAFISFVLQFKNTP